jgi:hypothetical protein
VAAWLWEAGLSWQSCLLAGILLLLIQQIEAWL